MKKYGLIVALVFVTLLVIAGSILPASAAQRAGDNGGSAVSNYSFRVEIDGVDAGQFVGVDGLGIEQEVVKYQNGDGPLTRKRPGRVTYGNITLKKVYTEGSILNDWIEAARAGNGDYTRKTISIILYDKNQTEIKRWNCFEAFPELWKLAPLDGRSNDVLVEELVVVIEWFEEA